MRILTILFLTNLFTTPVQQQPGSELLNIKWNFVYMLDTQTKQITNKGAYCNSTLTFNSDSTYSGHGCCNVVFPMGKNDTRFEIKNKYELTMSPPSRTKVGCNAEADLENLIFRSWGQASNYTMDADTLIIWCKNNKNLYYVK